MFIAAPTPKAFFLFFSGADETLDMVGPLHPRR